MGDEDDKSEKEEEEAEEAEAEAEEAEAEEAEGLLEVLGDARSRRKGMSSRSIARAGALGATKLQMTAAQSLLMLRFRTIMPAEKPSTHATSEAAVSRGMTRATNERGSLRMGKGRPCPSALSAEALKEATTLLPASQVAPSKSRATSVFPRRTAMSRAVSPF